jgi:MFS family permease
VTRDFARLVAAATISNFGSMLTAIALPLFAIQWLDATPAQIAALNAAGILPGIALGLFAAHEIDRRRRRPVLIAADLARAALFVALPVAAFAGVLTMAHVVAFAFARGLFDFAFGVAESAYLPSLVPAAELVRANSRLQAGDSSAEIAGFAAGGVLVQWLSAPLALFVDAATYLASAALLFGIRTAEPAPAAAPARGARGAALFAGFREIARSPSLCAIAGANVLAMVGAQTANAVYMLFVYRELGFAPGLLGVLFALGAVSSLAAAFAAERLPKRWAEGRVMAGGLALYALGPVLLALAPGPTLLGVAAIAAQQLVGDGGYVLFEIHQRSLRQTLTARELLGRVGGAIRFANNGALLAGAALGGWLGGAWGLRATLYAAAACTALAAGAALFVRREETRRARAAVEGDARAPSDSPAA